MLKAILICGAGIAAFSAYMCYCCCAVSSQCSQEEEEARK